MIQPDTAPQTVAPTETRNTPTRRRLRRAPQPGPWAMRVVYVLFLALGILYSVKTPAFETPDEIWHFAFIHHVANGQGLPVSTANTQELWQQQGVQAPGYYLAAAALTAWIDTTDFPAVFARANPHRAIGQPQATANRNYLLPYPEDGWPWRGTFLALHITRLFSVALGLLTIWATYRTLLLLTRPTLAFFGAATLAFIPQFIFISAAASNDNAVNALAALVLWRTVALILPPPQIPPAHPTLATLRHDFIVLGVLLGLAALSKLSALGLVGIAGLAVLGYSWERRDWRIVLHAALWIGLPLLAIAGWWYARNFWLYGDPLAWNIWRANILLRVEPAGWSTIARELGSLEQSFWGLFGWMNVPYPPMIYSFFRSLLWMVGLGLIFAIIGRVRRGWKLNRRDWAGALLWLWLGVLTISWLRFMEIAPAAQGRYFFPAAPALGLLFALGLHGWRLWTLPWLTIIVLFVLSLVTPWWIIQPAYTPPPVAAASSHLIPAEAQVGAAFRITGVQSTPGPVAPGEVLTVTVAWETLAQPTQDYSVFVHLVDRDGLTIAQLDTVPGGGLLPTSRWNPGDTHLENYRVAIPPTAYTPNQAHWAVGLYGGDSQLHTGPVAGPRLPVELTNAPPGIRVENSALHFGTVEVIPPPGEVPNALRARFADGMGLEGYTLNQRVLAPGDTLEVTLYWQSATPPSHDYTVFVHLLNEALEGVGGQDMPPDTPTSTWTPNSLYTHLHPVVIPADLPPGLYRLAVGMYARTPRSDFDRLALIDAGSSLGALQQAEGADRYLLGPVRIE